MRIVENVDPGQRYKIRIGGSDFPDPASRSQPDGVHGASEVVDIAYDWEDSEWLGVPLRDYVLYELHVGAFTLQGTFDGVAEHLGGLKELGVTALELMPVAQFPGERNWGYDGGLSLRRAGLVRGSRRAAAFGRRLPSERNRSCLGRRLQPLWA